MNIFGKILGALIGSLFGPWGIIGGIVVGHLVDVVWERTVQAGPYGAETQDLVPLLFSLFGRIVGHGSSFNQVQALFLQTVLVQMQLRPSDQQSALKAFRESFEETLQETYPQRASAVASISQEIYDNFFLDRSTLHWISATCRRLAGLGPILSGIIELLDGVSKNFRIFEETGSAGFNGEQSSESSYERWQNFRPSAAASEEAFQVLGLTGAASNDEVKKAYRTLARQYHPDVISHLDAKAAETAKEKFLHVQQAYERIRQSRKF